MNRPFTAFHFGLVQDVAVLRPLVRLAASMPSTDVHLLVAPKFAELDDDNKRWMGEIDAIGSEIGITPLVYESPFDVLRQLGSGKGLIVAGSESDARAHQQAHELFRAVPGRMRTATLQHGFECVGFLHNARHDATAGRNVRFAADIAVGWFEADRLHSVSAAERSKIYVAGPPSMIEGPSKVEARKGGPGLVCENLHSVRFATGRTRQDFLQTFTEFSGRLAMLDQPLALRPHPAGRFTKRAGVDVPANVEISDEPLYNLDLASFAYAISAPSTVLFDFAMAGVPVATWVDTDGSVDASNFEGLPWVATVDDWWRFNWAARWERETLLRDQAAFIAGLGIPKDVRKRYRGLLALA